MQIRDYMDKVSRYRSHIMGFCILSVSFIHAEILSWSGPLNYLMNKLWVVDIFFFITGMSVYRSLKRDDRLIPFYKRRLARIYPCYLPIILVYFIPIFALYTTKANLFVSIRELLGNIFMLGWLGGLNNQFNWYPQSLMIFYLVSPPLYMLLRHLDGDRRKLLALLGFFCITQLCFVGSGMMVAYSRSISFVLGLVAEDFASNRRSLKLNIPIMLIVWVIGNALCYYTLNMPMEISMYYGICWHPGVLVVPGMMLVLCWIYALCEKYAALRWINHIFRLLGEYSLEILLGNVLVCDMLVRLGIKVKSNVMWLVLIVAVCIVFILYGKLIKRVTAGKKSAAKA